MRAIVPIFFLMCVMLAGLVYAGELPYVSEAMRGADFWIAKQSAPDKIVMNADEIARFNAGLVKEQLTESLVEFPKMLSKDAVTLEAVKLFSEVERQKLFRKNGAMAKLAFYAPIRKHMALDALPLSVSMRYAVTTSFAHQRFIPTDEPLYTKPGNIHFDEVQNSGIDPATPVIVLAETRDGQWFLVKDGIATGWVKKGMLAFTDEKTWRGILEPKDFVVVTSGRTKVFLDEKMSRLAGVVRMGVRLPLNDMTADAVTVTYPLRRPDGMLELARGFVARKDVSAGYLPYNARTALTQAFKLLDAPYGWGDMDGKQDCSRFVNMVFATMGLRLPRNSAEQGRSGVSLGEFKREDDPVGKSAAITDKGVGGLTLLRLKGHVMLYLGEVDGQPFAIHETWGYQKKTATGEEFKPLKRVVVSDLSLGEGTAKGSLLERILAVRYLQGGSE